MGTGKTTSDMFEVGLSFRAADRGVIRPSSKRLSDFPRLSRLTEAVCGSHGNRFSRDKLNIICRRYMPGQGIPFHVDRPGLFAEEVFGCILRNTSEMGMQFRRKPGGRFRLAERRGTCFKLSGDARYKWTHGVPPLASGDRFSVTWRFLLLEGEHSIPHTSCSETPSCDTDGQRFLGRSRVKEDRR